MSLDSTSILNVLIELPASKVMICPRGTPFHTLLAGGAMSITVANPAQRLEPVTRTTVFSRASSLSYFENARVLGYLVMKSIDGTPQMAVKYVY
jgi:hypothetical protein